MPKAAAARVQHRDIHHVELAEPFTGWTIDLDRDFTINQLEDMQSGDMNRLIAAIGASVIDWNYVDKVGQPLPVGEAGLRQCGQALIRGTLEAVTGAVALPNE